MDFPTPADARDNEPLVKFGRPAPRASYGSAGNRDAGRLRSMPPETFTFDRAPLRDVLRLLAEQAGIPYIGIPDHMPEAQRLVTFKMNASPFTALESVARQHGVRLTSTDGVWFMNLERTDKTRIQDENELIGVIYNLKFDPAAKVEFAAGQNARAQAPSLEGALASSMQGQASAASPQALPLQQPQLVFRSSMPTLVNQIRAMLGLTPLVAKRDDRTGQVIADAQDFDALGGAILDGAIQFENVEKRPLPPGQGASAQASTGGSSTGQAAGSSGIKQPETFYPVYVPPQKPQVIYNEDTNILWVVATRKQHRWVAEYLSKVDRPQDLIAIEVKFFETNRNPQTDFGINWEGVFGGDGLQVTGSGSVGNGSSSSPNSVVQVQSTSNPELGGFTLAGQPYSAVLTVQQATLAVQAFAREREGSLVQYPRVLTINNREVAITSAENTPINSGVQNVSSGNVGGQNVGSLEYLPTGTQINILPKAIAKDQIALTVAITISSIIAEKQLDLGTGVNTYPITASRVYNASLRVDSGYTLAVGGLEKSTDLRSTGGVPLLKDIPGLGYLFKNKGRNRTRSNLIIFITPYVIKDPSRTPGISENPESTLPMRPGSKPPAPTFAPDGRLVGGEGAVDGALRWAEYQLKYFQQINIEARDDDTSISELRGVIERVRSLSAYLQAQMLDAAGYAPAELLDNSARADALLVDLNKVLAAARLDQFQLKEGFP